MVKYRLNLAVGWLLLCSMTSVFSQKNQLEFIENKGQWDDGILYRATYGNGLVEISKDGYRIMYGFDRNLSTTGNLIEKESASSETNILNQQSVQVVHTDDKPNYHYQVYEVKFQNAQTKSASVEAVGKYKTIYNYYQGNDRKKWASKCYSYSDIWVKNVYPHVDVHFYMKNNFFKYDIVVNPRGNHEDIAMKYLYTDKLQITKDNQLQIQTSPHYFLYEHIPAAYEEKEQQLKKINCKFTLCQPNTVKFLLKRQNPNHKIIIDPEFIFSTFSGSKANSLAYCSSFDKMGNLLGGSIVYDVGFPTTTGSDYRNDNSSFFGVASYDVGFIKLSADGADNLVATVFGSMLEDQPSSIKEAPDGSIMIVGKTNGSSSFPATIAPAGNTNVDNDDKRDLFIVKLDANNGQMLASRIIGGSDDDGYVPKDVLNISSNGIQGDAGTISTTFTQDDLLIVASPTISTDFPSIGLPYLNNNPSTVPNTTGFNKPYAVALLKMGLDLTTIYFSGYIGGNGSTISTDIEYNKTNNKLYVVGFTSSNMFESDARTSTAYVGSVDGFIAEISQSLNSYNVDLSTYVNTPGNNFNAVLNIDFDALGFPYITGFTSGNFPVKNASFFQTGGKQFVAKYQKNLSDAIFSTTFGPNAPTPSIAISSFLVDFCENMYVAGWGGAGFLPSGWQSGFATNATDGTLRTTFDPTGDYYVIVIGKNASQNIYSGYLGAIGSRGSVGDHFHFGENRFDEKGVLYQSVCVCASSGEPSPNYPVYPLGQVWSEGVGRNKNNNLPVIIPDRSSFCNAAYTKINFDYSGVKANLLGGTSVNKISTQTVEGCVPLKVILVDQTPANNKGKTFYWHFEDGSPDRVTTEDSIHHIFESSKIQKVRLIAEDINSCRTRDTSYIQVVIKEGEISLGFNPKLNDCSKNTLDYLFQNTTTSTVNPITNTVFYWNFGDGSPIDSTIGATAIRHIFKEDGNYRVTLKYYDPIFCSSNNAGDSISASFSTSAIKATASIPTNVCTGRPFTLINTSGGTYQTFTIDWGDGSPLTTLSILDTFTTHSYQNTGSYTITFTSTIPSCNLSAKGIFQIDVLDKPTVGFDFSPKVVGSTNEAVPNTTINFQNQTNSAATYSWNFGDGTTSELISPSHFFYKTGESEVKLVARGIGGCADSITKIVRSTFIPIVDVAKAFSPNGDGINDEIGVEGIGIAEIDWKIYDRVGELIFSTTDQTMKWNGRNSKGMPMPIDTYFYSLKSVFRSNEIIERSGEITIIK